MGVISELTLRLASNERDPDKPFGAQLRAMRQSSCPHDSGRLGVLLLHACVSALGA